MGKTFFILTNYKNEGLENMMTDETFYVNAEMCDKIKAETCAC
jgi:hypothetical protein